MSMVTIPGSWSKTQQSLNQLAEPLTSTTIYRYLFGPKIFKEYVNDRYKENNLELIGDWFRWTSQMLLLLEILWCFITWFWYALCSVTSFLLGPILDEEYYILDDPLDSGSQSSSLSSGFYIGIPYQYVVTFNAILIGIVIRGKTHLLAPSHCLRHAFSLIS